MINKKQLAKEWLIFLATFTPGFSMAAYRAYADVQAGYTKRVLRDDILLGSCLAFGPFVLTSLIRSIFWAVRTLRAK